MSLLDKVTGDQDRIDPPTARAGDRRAREPVEKVAVWFPQADRPSQFPDDWEEVPGDVAEELGLETGQKLVVRQRPVMHYDDAKLARRVTKSDGTVDPLELTQRIIEETVVESNFGIPETPIIPQEEGQPYLNTPNLAWFLTKWLGARALLDRVQNAVGQDIEDFRHGSGGS